MKFAEYPVSELQKALGLAPRKIYNHVYWCNAPKYVVPGTRGMSCHCSIVNDKDEVISDLGKSKELLT